MRAFARAFLATCTVAAAIHAGARPAPAQHAPGGPLAQFPSPMVDTTRPHPRLSPDPPPGHRLSVEAGLPRPIEVFLPAAVDPRQPLRVLVHFHGAAHVSMHAAAGSAVPTLAIAVHLGAGASAYEVPFSAAGTLRRVVDAARTAVARHLERELQVATVHLSAFSAGYGAVRAIARSPSELSLVDAVLLLDGLHASYEPERQVLAEGGRIAPAHLEPFVEVARRAAAGGIGFTVTHSEVFPGTFASTTEMTDALLAATGTHRRAVLTAGPLGMQQLSDTRAGRFRVLGFAGNSAPDHLDHLHALPSWLDVLLPVASGSPTPVSADREPGPPGP
jgi:hypothetical protein